MAIPGPTEASSVRNLKWLFSLRTLMGVGVLVAIPVAQHVAGIALPVPPLLGIVAALALLNAWTWWRIRRVRAGGRIGDGELFGQLACDVLALAVLLYLTGGAANPFAWFFLIPLMIAATVLSAGATWAMAALTTVCYSLLMFQYRAFGETAPMHHDPGFARHVFGMWFGFVLSAVLIAWFVVAMADTLRRRDRLLAEAREQALRDEQLVALGALATGAAHELGTPLATMAVVTGELLRQGDLSERVRRRVTLLREQIERCREALSVISASAGELRAEGGGLVQVGAFVEQVIAQWHGQRPGRGLDTRIVPGPPQARILNERTLRQALINLLNNAADASRDGLALHVHWDSETLQIEILDRGPGPHPHTRQSLLRPLDTDKADGLGLGLFLTHAALQRLGGEVVLLDRDGGGTRTRVRLPLTGWEDGRDPAR